MSDFDEYKDSVNKGLIRHEYLMREDYRQVDLLNAAEGSRGGCLLTLQDHLEYKALHEYFSGNCLKGLKCWSGVTSKVKILRQHMFPTEHYLTEDLLWSILSDHEEFIDWWRQNEAPYQEVQYRGKSRLVDVPTDAMFYRYQIWLALNSRWEELAKRCETILGMESKITKDRPYLIDHRFYLALARGEKEKMESILEEKCTKKNRRIRVRRQSGITENFIDSYATLFAKLAWRNGYEVEVETPWIPKDWLPVSRDLDYVDPPWKFLQEFDIWQPFPEPWTKFSPKKPAA